MTTKRILTGIRPTGPLHLGHYVGALKQWIELQDEYECFFLIADMQALTTHVDQPQLIEEAVRDVMLDWISVGLDPKRANVYFVLQSAILELTELTAYLSMLMPFTRLGHNPTIRAEAKRLEDDGKSVSAGFKIYPVSQAADILLFTPYPRGEGDELLVPVGEDQIPHLDDTNYLAEKFNKLYGDTLLACTPKVGNVGRLPGIDENPEKKENSGEEDSAEEGKKTKKMSKSAGNALFLKDDPARVRKLVAKMFTDKDKIYKGDPGHPDKCPVYMYHYAFNDDLASLRIRDLHCKIGTLGCVECKRDLAELLNNFLNPFRARRAQAEVEAPLGEYLARGTEKAREIGQKTMTAVRTAMHLDYPTVFNR